jgi:hypothetical protein
MITKHLLEVDRKTTAKQTQRNLNKKILQPTTIIIPILLRLLQVVGPFSIKLKSSTSQEAPF